MSSIPKPNREFRIDAREPRIGPSNRRRATLSVAGIAVVFLLAIAVWISVSPPSVNAADLKTVRVLHGDLFLGIAGYGKLIPSGLVVIGSKNGGQVASIEKQIGSMVTASEPILVIENADLRQKLREAEKVLVEKQVDLMTLESGALSRRNQVRSELQNLGDDLRVANLEVKGLRTLAESKIITPIEFEKAAIRASTLQRRIGDLSAELRQLDALYTATKIANATVVATLEDDVRRLRKEVDELAIKAPTNGTVFEMQAGLSVGTQIAPGATVARLSISDDLAAEIAIPAARAREVVVGQSANVRVGDKELSAKVLRIDPQVIRDEVLIVLSLNKSESEGLFAGQPVSGEIIVRRFHEVTYMARPFGATEAQDGILFEVDSGGGDLHRREVHYGLGDTRHIVVERGLEEGAEVVLDDMRQYSSSSVLRKSD